MSNDEQPKDPREWKIFPRNLTARAAYIVPGNPASSRPESGVDNCYPGLEIDARNIQKFFFPGMYFNVYRSDGSRLVALRKDEGAPDWRALGLTDEDLKLKAGLYLWVLKGRTKAEQEPKNPEAISMAGTDINNNVKDGLYAWRKVRDLYDGRVGIAIGPGVAEDGDPLEEALTALEEEFASEDSTACRVKRGEKQELRWAVLVAPRSKYLNEQGVLEPEVYQPGELTRTLCTPWTYDFRDCQCFYWASNKPDTAASEDGRYAYLNFQRKNRAVEPQTEDIAYDYQARRAQEIDYAEMMVDWQQLRPVLNSRELGGHYQPAKSPPGPLLSLKQIKEELTYLAAVEHGLAVQYLYGYYSIDAPKEQPASDDVRAFRLWSAAQEIFKIAIDEMRHFRWANKMLKLLGAKTTTARGATLGRRLNVPFYLMSLSSVQLQWFIDVERPSRSTKDGLDGMYVGILNSLQHLLKAKPEAEKGNNVELDKIEAENLRQAVEIAKLILDEGEAHYERFSTAQQNLAFFDDADRGYLPAYIRGGYWSVSYPNLDDVPVTPVYGVPRNANDIPEARALQEKSDKIYQAFVALLKVAFAMEDPKVSGKALSQAISFMLHMNDLNFEIAELGATPLFSLPKEATSEPPKNKQAARALVTDVWKLLEGMPEMDAAPEIPAGAGARAGAHASSLKDALTAFESLVETYGGRYSDLEDESADS